ncbi:hypothetical protein [Variovorax sp. UC122_21]|uniref:hypothetical protein n=1 Tax=Variovorax sp. UC122_21 TaxID=3374554 RepID=UPI003756E80F
MPDSTANTPPTVRSAMRPGSGAMAGAACAAHSSCTARMAASRVAETSPSTRAASCGLGSSVSTFQAWIRPKAGSKGSSSGSSSTSKAPAQSASPAAIQPCQSSPWMQRSSSTPSSRPSCTTLTSRPGAQRAPKLRCATASRRRASSASGSSRSTGGAAAVSGTATRAPGMATVASPGVSGANAAAAPGPVSKALRIALSGGQRWVVMASVPEWLCLQA